VINNTTDNPDAESDFRMKVGMHAGVFAVVKAGERVAIGAELLYSNKGVKAVDAPINLHYVSLPLFFRYYLTDNIIAEAGPELSYLVTVTSRYGRPTNTWNNKIDLGFDVGMLYHFSSKFFAGARFNAGFSSVIENSGTNTLGEKVRYQNRVLQVSVGYTLFDKALGN
jgi:hypothetical protein